MRPLDGFEWIAREAGLTVRTVPTGHFERLAKHFTDAELAAECYQAAWLYECAVQDHDGYDGMRQTQILRRQANVLHRFATHPHYSDAD